MKNYKWLELICLILTILGSVGFFLAGTFKIDFINLIFGETRTIGGDFIRILMVLSSLYVFIFWLIRNKKSK